MHVQAKVRFRTLRVFRLATHGSQAAAAARSTSRRLMHGSKAGTTPKKVLAKRLAQASGMSMTSPLTGTGEPPRKRALFPRAFGRPDTPPTRSRCKRTLHLVWVPDPDRRLRRSNGPPFSRSATPPTFVTSTSNASTTRCALKLNVCLSMSPGASSSDPTGAVPRAQCPQESHDEPDQNHSLFTTRPSTNVRGRSSAACR